MKSDTKKTIKTYIIATVIPLLVGVASALLTMDNMQIYGQIKTPPLSPPSILFPIVWTILYILMGISSALIWQNKSKNLPAYSNGITYYAASLVFNFGWSIIFFNLENYLVAFLWLLVLLYFIIRTILEYLKVNKTAAYLQTLYMLWVIFAGYLNFGIYLLNR